SGRPYRAEGTARVVAEREVDAVEHCARGGGGGVPRPFARHRVRVEWAAACAQAPARRRSRGARRRGELAPETRDRRATQTRCPAIVRRARDVPTQYRGGRSQRSKRTPHSSEPPYAARCPFD